MLPSLTVVVVSRKDILVFDTWCGNFIDGWILLACSNHSSSSLSPCVHFMSTSSINRNHERGCLSDERSNRSSRSPIKMFNPTFETSFRRCLIPKERPRKNSFGFAQNQWRTTLDRRFYKHTPSSRWNSKIRRHKFSKKRDAKFKRNGIKPKTSIDCTEDTVVRKTRTWRFRRKTKAENRKSNVVANRSSKPLNSAESSVLSGVSFFVQILLK